MIKLVITITKVEIEEISTSMELILIISILIIIHGYGGYIIPIVLFGLFKQRKINKSSDASKYHTICIVIAAYNEESCIEEKIINTLDIDYPKEYLNIFIVTDGSTDNTVDIVNKYKEVRCFHQNVRSGKMAAIDRVMPFIKNEITVFTDANTLLNKDCLTFINTHFNNSNIGGVAGEKKINTNNSSSSNKANQEGIYWKYESFLKKIDSAYYSVVGAAGELYAIRTSLYEYPGKDIILDDFIISLNICKNGYLFKYEPNAYATELPSLNIKEESKRKIRIAAGSIQAIFKLKELLNIFKYPMLSYLYLSHRVLRWTIIPILLILIFIVNLILQIEQPSPWITSLFIIQLIFYVIGLLGYFKFIKLSKLTSIPFYFIFMNVSQIIGAYRYIMGNQKVTWEKSKRTKQ